MERQASGYTGIQIGLHWLIAALVFFQLVFGESMTAMIDAAEEGEAVSASDQILGTAHYWVGIAILALALARVVVRLRTGAPEHAGDANPMLQLAATAMHGLFYVLLFAVPVVGLLGYYFGDPWGEIHTLAKPVFIILIVVHAGAALFNQFVLKDGTLMRMLKPVR